MVNWYFYKGCYSILKIVRNHIFYDFLLSIFKLSIDIYYCPKYLFEVLLGWVTYNILKAYKLIASRFIGIINFKQIQEGLSDNQL